MKRFGKFIVIMIFFVILQAETLGNNIKYYRNKR